MSGRLKEHIYIHIHVIYMYIYNIHSAESLQMGPRAVGREEMRKADCDHPQMSLLNIQTFFFMPHRF